MKVMTKLENIPVEDSHEALENVEEKGGSATHVGNISLTRPVGADDFRSIRYA